MDAGKINPEYDITQSPGSSIWLTRVRSRSWFHKHSNLAVIHDPVLCMGIQFASTVTELNVQTL